jgi:hypothetical protein
MFGRYTTSTALDVGLRLLLTAVAGVVLFHPNDTIALSVSPLVFIGIVAGIWRHRIVSPPAELTVDTSADVRHDDKLSEMMQEAKREY